MKNFKDVILFVFILLILTASSCDQIKEYEFLKYVPEEVLSSLGTQNFNEIITKVSNIIKKETKNMDLNEALITKCYYEFKKDIDMQIKCAERILLICADQNISQKVTLELAQIYLAQSEYEKAEKYAKDYQVFYPGNLDSKLAAYVEIQANYLLSLDSDRDQKRTEKALELSKKYLERYSNVDNNLSNNLNLNNKEDINYINSVTQIMQSCYNKLFDSEINIVNTYINKYNYNKSFSAFNAAQIRLLHVKQKLLPNIKDKEKDKILSLVELKLTKAAEEIKLVKIDNRLMSAKAA